MEHHELIIIGSGPSGYTAAIYAARAGLKPILYTGIEVGGQLMQTSDVENYPGYPKGILGPEMMEDFKNQAERFGTEIRFGWVSDVDFSGDKHVITIDGSTQVSSDAIIIATGASAKWLGLPSEQAFNGSGVSACAVCDGFFFKGQDVAVVGAGDTACEEALYLSKICNKVYQIVRRDEMRASKIMQDRVMKAGNIEVLWNTETDEILGDKTVHSMRVKNNQTGELSTIAIQGFFVAIGHKPNTDIFKGKLDMDADGYLIAKAGSTYTNVKGVFAAGDVADKHYRQAVTAAGSGCMAALDAERYLAKQAYEMSIA